MPEVRPTFDDGEAYERFMGRWSRSVGAVFLDWLAPPRDARWLDVGCGTGAFTEIILNTCAPAAVTAIDPAPAQVEHARQQPVGQRAEFRVADSQSLPFPDGAFDVVASALVINFVPDRPKALREMLRVTRPGGLVAGYIWDFSGEGEPYAPLRHGLRRIGVELTPSPGTEDSRRDALSTLFDRAGFKDIATRAIDVTGSFPDFDYFWSTNTPRFHPVGKTIASLTDTDRARLIEIMRTELLAGPDGSITYTSRANAIKARVPG